MGKDRMLVIQNLVKEWLDRFYPDNKFNVEVGQFHDLNPVIIVDNGVNEIALEIDEQQSNESIVEKFMNLFALAVVKTFNK